MCFLIDFLYHTHPVVYFIIWEMHGFPDQFLIAREIKKDSTLWGRPDKLVLILFP